MSDFGKTLVKEFFDLVDRAKLSGKPNALSRAVLTPQMEKLANEIALQFKIVQKAKTRKQRTEEMDDVWLGELEEDPTYQGIDVRRELGKAQAWAKAGGGKKAINRRRFINWLNRAASELPIRTNGEGRSSRTPERPNPYSAPLDWKAKVLALPYADDRLKELCSGEWLDVPLHVREEVVRK
jgi:hypothetical protein